MSSVRATSGAPERSELMRATVLACSTALVAFLGIHKFGAAGILTPLAIVLFVVMLQRPAGAMALLFVLAVLCEGPTFGFLHFTSHLYDQVYKGLTLLDMLVVLAIIAVGLDLIGRRRAVYIPPPLVPMAVALLLAMVVGAITGSAHGQSLRTVTLSQNILLYLLLLPIVVANIDLNRRKIAIFLGCAMALAILKAVFGLIEIASDQGAVIEGSARLTYYEPTANWLIMIALFTVCAALAARVSLPRWMLAGSPLLLASLLLSYRRSFWIAAGLGLVLVVLLGLSPVGRRLLVPTAVLVAVAIFLIGSVSVQSQSPVLKRFESLSPTSLNQNAEASYRNDERANVLHAISENPITGLGINVPWSATVRTLSVEHEEGRLYVHFAALWFWLKLGILGLIAYVSFIAGALVLSWNVWRRSVEPAIRAFGLASLAGWLGLIAIEATASFTGVDPRFTVLVCIQLGVLALLARGNGYASSASSDSTAVV
jgi:O-antigen ligase